MEQELREGRPNPASVVLQVRFAWNFYIDDRRLLFATFADVWSMTGEGKQKSAIPWATIREVLVTISAQPMQYTCLRARLEPTASASNAPMSGGGLVVSNGLPAEDRAGVASEAEENFVKASQEAPKEWKELLFDQFTGFGAVAASGAPMSKGGFVVSTGLQTEDRAKADSKAENNFSEVSQGAPKGEKLVLLDRIASIGGFSRAAQRL